MHRKLFMRIGTFMLVSVIVASCHKFGDYFDHGNGEKDKGFVYILSNESSQNKVLVYQQQENGQLQYKTAVNTGGKGNDMGLGSQGAVVISQSKKWLYAVNAGDNTISSFKVSSEGGLTPHQTIASGGATPLSLDVYGQLLYVVNGGGNICGFKIDDNGDLSKLAGSDKPLSMPMAGPAQISFKPGGKVLVVTEKATNSISTYLLDGMGVTGNAHTQDAEAETPFGFAFAFHDKLIVTDAFGGRPGESQITSYTVGYDGNVNLVSRLPIFQAAACWIVLSKSQEYGLITNTGSNSISAIRIRPSGELVLLDSVAAKTGNSPIDICISANEKYVYALSQMSRAISQYKIEGNGKLKSIGELTGLTPAASGMAVF